MGRTRRRTQPEASSPQGCRSPTVLSRRYYRVENELDGLMTSVIRNKSSELYQLDGNRTDVLLNECTSGQISTFATQLNFLTSGTSGEIHGFQPCGLTMGNAEPSLAIGHGVWSCFRRLAFPSRKQTRVQFTERGDSQSRPTNRCSTNDMSQHCPARDTDVRYTFRFLSS